MRQTLASWMHEVLATEDERCIGFSLVHYNGNQQIELRAIRSGSKPIDPKETASQLNRFAETHAAGIAGVQQYEIQAFFEGSDEPKARYPMRKAGDVEVGGIGTEGPTPTGLLSQLMRHNEALVRLHVQRDSEVTLMLERTISRLATQNERLQAESLDAITFAKQMMLDTTEIEFKRMRAMDNFQTIKQLKQKALELAPAAINLLAGKDVIPQGVADESIFNMLAETLTEEQAMALANVLTPEQLTPIAMRLQRAQQLKNQQAEAQVKAANGSKKGQT